MKTFSIDGKSFSSDINYNAVRVIIREMYVIRNIKSLRVDFIPGNNRGKFFISSPQLSPIH